MAFELPPPPSDSGGGQSSDVSYLGVPDDYVRPVPQTSLAGHAYDMQGMVGLTPMYRTGDDVRRLTMLSVEDLARLQGRMASVGLIGPSTRFRVGVADSATTSAYKSLLTLANKYGWSDSEALDALAQQGGIKGGDVTADANGSIVPVAQGPHTEKQKRTDITEATYTDPATARATLRSVWQQAFGRDPNEAEMRRYAKRLRAAEAGDNVTTTQQSTHYNAAGQATSTRSRVTHQDDDTDPTADVVADQMSRTGRLGKERNTRMVGVDYMGAALSLPGMNPGG